MSSLSSFSTRTTTRKIVVACVAIVFLACFAGASALAQTTTFRANGSEGDADFGCNSQGYCLQFFEVAQSVPLGPVRLSFEITIPGTDPLHSILGIGPIAFSDFLVAPKQLVLNTDLSKYPDFQILQCDFFSGECNPIAGGVVNLTWTADGLSSFRQSGSATFQFGAFSQTFVGPRAGQSASVIGSITGITFAPGDLSGSIITNQNVQISRSKP